MRQLAFIYGAASYLTFLAAFLYLIGFLGNFAVPRSVDSPPVTPLPEALAVDIGLLLLFGLQHSVMARPTFKALWTRVVPKSVERSTYVLASNLALALLYWQWRAPAGVVWNVDDPIGRGALWALFAAGWILVLVATMLIDHFDLFGLRQVWFNLKGRPYESGGFKTPGPYKLVRHPLYVGWLMAFWATPTMTVSHLIFSLGTTVYILIAIYFEERNLMHFLGDEYREYRKRVPMLIPRIGKR